MTQTPTRDSFAPIAALYDADMGEERSHSGDVMWYREGCRGTRAVLEFGAGTGRIALPVAADGAFVTAVDCSRAMLAQLVCKAAALGVGARVDVVEARMEDFMPSRTYDRVIIPFRTLNHAERAGDMGRILHSCANAISPGGALMLDVLCRGPWMDQPAEREHVFRAPGAGGLVYRAAAVRPIDSDAVLVKLSYSTGEQAGGGAVATTWFRNFLPRLDAFLAMLRDAHLIPSSVAADFAGTPVDSEAGGVVVVRAVRSARWRA